MLKTIFTLTALSLLIFLIAMLLMFISKGVRVKGAHARGEHKRLDKAKRQIALKKKK